MSIASRLVLLTLLYTLLLEVVLTIFGIATYRKIVLQSRVSNASLAARAILTNPNPQIDIQQSNALLEDAKILDLAIIREGRRERLLIPSQRFTVNNRVDLQKLSVFHLIEESFSCMNLQNNEITLISGKVNNELKVIETLVSERSICDQQWLAIKRMMPFMFIMSLILAGLVYFTSRVMFIKPIEYLANSARRFDAGKKDLQLVENQTQIKEFSQLTTAFRNMQIRSIRSYRERERLAILGESVSKIQHDLRNMLSTAQMLADSFETSNDPSVKKRAPRLVRSINRAVELSSQTLEFGNVGNREPLIESLLLYPLLKDIVETEQLHAQSAQIQFQLNCAKNIKCVTDSDFLKRILSNLVRNAWQVLKEGTGGVVEISVEHDQKTYIWIKDNGPGFSEKAQEFIFQPFKGSTRKGGTGLGLAICKELSEFIGAELKLHSTDNKGTKIFLILSNS